jgi:F-type H+-transporting ATPase subunit g
MQNAHAHLLAYRQPVTYNFNVAREVLKQVYRFERLQPPTSLGQITSAYSAIYSRAVNPAYWREIARTGEWQKVAIYGAEAYGIYKVRLRWLVKTKKRRKLRTLCSDW